MVEEGIVTLLTTNSGVQGLIPNDIAGTPQIYWELPPKGAQPPYIVLSRVFTDDHYTVSGFSGVREAIFQADCITDSKAGTTTGYYTCRSIATAVRSVLSAYRGNLPDTQSTPVESVLTIKDWDLPYEEGAKGFTFHRLLQFRVFYKE